VGFSKGNPGKGNEITDLAGESPDELGQNGLRQLNNKKISAGVGESGTPQG